MSLNQGKEFYGFLEEIFQSKLVPKLKETIKYATQAHTWAHNAKTKNINPRIHTFKWCKGIEMLLMREPLKGCRCCTPIKWCFVYAHTSKHTHKLNWNSNAHILQVYAHKTQPRIFRNISHERDTKGVLLLYRLLNDVLYFNHFVTVCISL